MTTRSEWAAGFLAYANWEVSQEKVIALVAQASKEDTLAAWNPLATTEPAPGDSDYNAAGVKNYSTLQVGYGATLATFLNGHYPTLVAVLSDPGGGSATTYATSPDLDVWGTGNCLAYVEEIKGGDPQGYLSREVASSSTPAPPLDPGPAPDPTPPNPQPDPQPQPEVLVSVSTAHDPVSGGVWATDENGATFAYLGAPYIPGLNTHPDYKAARVVAIEYWAGGGQDGVVFFTDAPAPTGGPYSLYRFLRTGAPA